MNRADHGAESTTTERFFHTNHGGQNHEDPLRQPILLAAAAILLLVGCKPDLTSDGGIKIGDKKVAWNGQLALTAADAVAATGGRCAFDLEYTMTNAGDGPASPAFWNRLRTGTQVVTQQSGLTLAPESDRTARTQGYLAPGSHTLTLTLDDEGDVAESDETNNRRSVTVDLRGSCAEQPDCKTYDGFGRYSLRLGCDQVKIDGEVYSVEKSGTGLQVNGYGIGRGIFRKNRPWLYVHQIEEETADLTFDSGRKPLYPLYTGLSGAIFEVYAHPWEMERSTAAAFEDDFWLVSHRWSDDGLFFDLQRRLDGDDTRWVLERGDIFVPGDGSEAIVREIATGVQVLSFDPAARKAMVRFKPLP